MLNCNQARKVYRYLLLNDEYVNLHPKILLRNTFLGTVCGEKKNGKKNIWYLSHKAWNDACGEWKR